MKTRLAQLQSGAAMVHLLRRVSGFGIDADSLSAPKIVKVAAVTAAQSPEGAETQEVISCADTRSGSILSLQMVTKDAKFEKLVLSFKYYFVDFRGVTTLFADVENLEIPLVFDFLTFPSDPAGLIHSGTIIWHGGYDFEDDSSGNLLEFRLQLPLFDSEFVEGNVVKKGAPYSVVMIDYESKAFNQVLGFRDACEIKTEVLSPLRNSINDNGTLRPI